MRWTVLLPMKSPEGAKARLADASPDAAAHARLVAAIRADTYAAAVAAAGVARVVIVTDRPGDGEHVFVQRGAGLNSALAEAAADAAGRWPADAVAALVGDLPALRPEDLAAALAIAATSARSFVRDADGTGTTLLTALPGVELRPAFGTGSAARHEAIAREVTAAPGLRRDVDVAADLTAARLLGVGVRTAALFPGGTAGGDSARDAKGAGR